MSSLKNFKARLNFVRNRVPSSGTIFNGMKSFDVFNLGNSFILYYIFAFGFLPLLNFFFPYLKLFDSLAKSGLIAPSVYYYVFAALGLFSFALGFKYVRLERITERLRRKWNYEWRHPRVILVFGIIFVAGLAVKAIRIFNGGFFYLDRNQAFTSHPLYSLIGLLDWAGTISLVIALVAYFLCFLKYRDERFWAWRYIAWGTMAVEIFYGFFMGARGTVLVPLVAYVVVRYYVEKRSLRYVLIAFLIIFFILMPLLNINRSPEVFFNAYHIVNKTEIAGKINAFKNRDFRNLASSVALPEAERVLSVGEYVFDSSIMRIDQSRILLAVFHNIYEFKPMDSVSRFFASLGPPRFLWKDKPIIRGDISALAQRSGILAPGDTTSVGATVVGDWYIGFGIWGVVFGMFLLGVFFRFLSGIFINRENIYPTGLVFYAITWLHTIPGAIEGWQAPLWAGLVKLLAILILIHFFISRGKKEKIINGN